MIQLLKTNFSEFAEKISIKMGIAFSRIPLTPNQWTVLSILPAILGFFALVNGQMALAIVFFAASALIDGIDGGVARVTGNVTSLGAYLDGIVDRIVEALLFFGLMFSGFVEEYYIPSYAWLALLLFAGTIFTSYARAYAHHRRVVTDEKKLRKMGGLLERPERLILVFLGMAAWFFNPIYLTYAIAAAAILSCITVLQRVWFVVKNAE